VNCTQSKAPRAQTHAINLSWHYSVGTALENARWANKPVLIVFSTDWCVACKSLKEHTLTNPKTMIILQKFILVELDIEHHEAGLTNRGWMEKFCSQPGWIPITIIITPWEKKIDELVGSATSYEFNKFLNGALSRWDAY